MEKILGHYALTYLPEHIIRKCYSTFNTSSYVREADMSRANRNNTTLLGPKMGDMLCRFGDMSPTCQPTQHCRPKIANTDIRHVQLSPPMASMLKVSPITIHHMIVLDHCNMALYFLNGKLTLFFILLNISI